MNEKWSEIDSNPELSGHAARVDSPVFQGERPRGTCGRVSRVERLLLCREDLLLVSGILGRLLHLTTCLVWRHFCRRHMEHVQTFTYRRKLWWTKMESIKHHLSQNAHVSSKYHALCKQCYKIFFMFEQQSSSQAVFTVIKFDNL